MQGVQVQSPDGELRSHMLHGAAKKNGKKEKGLLEIRATFLGVQDHPEHRVGREVIGPYIAVVRSV